MNGPHDQVIIGAGSTGLTAAGFVVQLWARIALVEKHRPGSECTWTGCVPGKTLVQAAKVEDQRDALLEMVADVHRKLMGVELAVG
jgi:pyruvate/2-oxoglutarate dehydrogenase complex dihydrolipoamide dehydrogenase (E3) component